MSEKNLKLRFKLKDLEFEIEGNETTVKKEFENFKGFVTNDILPQINKIPNSPPSNSELESKPSPLELNQPIDITSEEVTDFPVMKEIVHRDLPNGEQEWILIYAFYASNFGKDTFTRADIASLYESSNRKTANTVRHLSRDLKRVLNKGYIKFVNDTDYIIKPDGISQVRQILEGKSTSKTNSSKTTKSKANKGNSGTSTNNSKSSSKSQSFKLDRNLNLRPEGKATLKDFYNNYNVNSTPERILVIVFYLKEILQLETINTDQIYTAYDKLNVRVPKSLYQLISDTKNKSGWLEFDSMDDIGLSIQGRNAMKYDLLKS